MSEQEPRRDIKLQVMLSADELAALDDWRFQHRYASRAAAVRRLIELGMRAPSAGTGSQT